MNKSITYYFEDVSRLDEVTIDDLQAWVAEEPYSQPLRKLLTIKVERSGQQDTDAMMQNAAHRNIDIDLTEAIGHLVDEKDGLDSSDIPKVGEASVSDEETTTIAKPITHDMATDEQEELVIEEVLEIAEPETTIDELELGEDIADESMLVKYGAKGLGIAGSVSDEEALVDVETFEVDPAKKSKTKGKNKPKKKAKKKSKSVSKATKQKKSNKEKEADQKVKAKKTKKKVKGSAMSKVKDDKAQAVAQDENSKSKSEKVKPKKNKKSSKKKTSRAAPKMDGKVIAKEVRYIYVEERQPVDYRIHEYTGESDYIKWLMSTKIETKEDNVAGKKKKADKKKKKAKAIKKVVLKAAEDSVKKRDVIISETLADLLAGQGYEKRAKKMYKQLSLIFPEKSSYFAAKIKKLKKK